MQNVIDRAAVLRGRSLGTPPGGLGIGSLGGLERHEVAVLVPAERHHDVVGDRHRIVLSSALAGETPAHVVYSTLTKLNGNLMRAAPRRSERFMFLIRTKDGSMSIRTTSPVRAVESYRTMGRSNRQPSITGVGGQPIDVDTLARLADAGVDVHHSPSIPLSTAGGRSR